MDSPVWKTGTVFLISGILYSFVSDQGSGIFSEVTSDDVEGFSSVHIHVRTLVHTRTHTRVRTRKWTPIHTHTYTHTHFGAFGSREGTDILRDERVTGSTCRWRSGRPCLRGVEKVQPTLLSTSVCTKVNSREKVEDKSNSLWLGKTGNGKRRKMVNETRRDSLLLKG